MKTDPTLTDWEVPSNAKDSVQFITEDLTSQIVKDFQDRLRQDGLKISPSDVQRLASHVQQVSGITLKVSVKVDRKMMSDLMIEPQPLTQVSFSEFEKESIP